MLGAEFFSSVQPSQVNGERKKKKSIKGVLEKCDLTESYSLGKKSKLKARRKSTGENLIIADTNNNNVPTVKAVEFKEAVIEELLSSVDSKHEEKPGRKISGEYKLIQHANKANLLRNDNIENRDNFSGYEPNNSLRRLSTAAKPNLKRDRVLTRRRSEFDAPLSMANTVSSFPKISEVNYEPENSLRRVRKTSGNNSGNLPPQRQRRTGLGMIMPTKAADSSENDTEFSQSETSSIDSISNGDGSCPSTPRLPRHKQPLFSVSIPEYSEVSSVSSFTNSPKSVRKTSVGKAVSLESFSIAASPRILRKQTSTPNFFRQSSMLALLPTSKPGYASSASSADSSGSGCQELTCHSSPVKKASLRVGASHNNATRYWDWYVLNASYSWKNFNTDKHLCY